MEKEKLTQAILSAISSEVGQWPEESQQIKDGYGLLLRMRNIGKILMEQSIGKTPKSRNEKKAPHMCREIRSEQSSSFVTT